MGRLDGKVAFVTGAARGQGRSHAVRLAEEGADIIAVDICRQIDTSPIPMSTPADLQETVAGVEALDRRIVVGEVDVRDLPGMTSFDAAVAELGRLDVICVNAGISGFGLTHELSVEAWRDAIDVMLTGAWITCRVGIPHIMDGGRGGSIILTSSLAGLRPLAHLGHYVSAKHGEVGLMRSLALELAPHLIRVNTVHPSSVDTPMIHNPAVYAVFAPDVESPTRDDLAPRFQRLNLLPIPWLDARDISNAVLFLASDEARYITGVTLPVDAGAQLK